MSALQYKKETKYQGLYHTYLHPLNLASYLRSHYTYCIKDYTLISNVKVLVLRSSRGVSRRRLVVKHLLHFLAFFHVASLSPTGVDNKKVHCIYLSFKKD